MVREHEVGRKVLTHCFCVRREVAVELGAAQILQQARLESFVAVEDEDRE